MEKKMIAIKTPEEIENITASTLKADAAEASHMKAIDNAIKVLTAELNAYKKAYVEKYDGKKTTGKLVNYTPVDFLKFDEKRFANDHAEVYQSYKTLPVHQDRVTF